MAETKNQLTHEQFEAEARERMLQHGVEPDEIEAMILAVYRVAAETLELNPMYQEFYARDVDKRYILLQSAYNALNWHFPDLRAEEDANE